MPDNNNGRGDGGSNRGLGKSHSPWVRATKGRVATLKAVRDSGFDTIPVHTVTAGGATFCRVDRPADFAAAHNVQRHLRETHVGPLRETLTTKTTLVETF